MTPLPTAKSPLMTALEQIEREKGVKAEDILEMIKGAIKSALQKAKGKDADIRVEIDSQTAAITAAQVKKVVEEITIPDQEMTAEEGKKYKKGVGDEVVFPINDMDLFARIAAQTAKQVLTQKVREVERDNLYDEFKPKEGEVISGAVHRFMDRNIILDLGKTEAIMPLREQIRRERYGVGERVRAVILKVDKAQRGPQVLVSRASPLFLRRLFELEVPEINEKIVEVIEIVRDPGFRAKALVRSNNPKVDAVGACIGIRGSRIRSIMNELSGERIDLVPFTDDIAAFIGGSLTPAKASSVKLVDKENKRAEVIVAKCTGKPGVITEEKKPTTQISPQLYDLTTSSLSPSARTARTCAWPRS
ncbi:MAG: transcription termination factor NusA [Elusimicrobia bacterium]|nr:transcription termination factor NusA [Elusimicrobiota bacterium]